MPKLSPSLSALAMADLAAATVDAGATAWVLTSTALVFLMTAGLSFFYGGLVRDTSIINTMTLGVICLVCVIEVSFSRRALHLIV